MEIFHTILILLDVNFTYSLFPLILTLILVELVFKNRFKTKSIFNLIRWFIIYYTLVTCIYFILRLLLFTNDFDFINRATGPYQLTYWLMLFCSIILPFSLLYKKLAEKPFYLLLVAVLMKIGVYFEIYIILVTNFHRDYAPYNSIDRSSQITSLLMNFAKGFILAAVLICLFELFGKIKNRVQEN